MPEKARVAVLISGTGTTMSALLYASKLEGCPYEIVLVASNKADAGGLAIAKAEGVPTAVHSHKGIAREEHDALMEAELRKSGADFVALCGYMRVLSPGMVERWAGKILNTHPSLLPKYKGLDTHQRAIDARESHGGCTVHVVIPELDAGPVLGQVEVGILPGDTADALGDRVRLAEYQLYPRVLAEYVSRPYRADWLRARIEQMALALPEAEARDSHGSPAWRVAGGKYFAYFNDRHHGEAEIAVLVKTSGQEELMALVERDPGTYYKPAYYGASGWVGIVLNRPGVDWDHVANWLQRSWRAVAPKRLTALMDAADDF